MSLQTTMSQLLAPTKNYYAGPTGLGNRSCYACTLAYRNPSLQTQLQQYTGPHLRNAPDIRQMQMTNNYNSAQDAVHNQLTLFMYTSC
jgi:hypothetical protein